MKKGTLIGIILALFGLVCLGALTIYLTVSFHTETFTPSAGTQVESEADAILEALQEPLSSQTSDASAETASEDGTAAADQNQSTDLVSPLIWVGDSRTVGMHDAMDNDDCYIAAAGEGYEWLSASGLPLLYDAIAAYPDSPVIFNFGVNDYDNMALYLALYQSLVQDYPDTRFYFLSVNPIEPTLCHNITNEEIADFNQHLKDLFPDTYIDSFTYLMVNQAVTIDGIHYSSEDYRKIYEFATAQIAADPENAD